MPVKIRLSRHGRKSRPFYHIVVADSRAPRDGRYIERIGSYNPNTNPATIDLNTEKAVEWMTKGAQPTDTCRAILSYKGAMYKKHLLGGVDKGAFTAEEAEVKFNAWMDQKASQVQAKEDGLANEAEADKKRRFEAEEKVNQTRAEAIAKKNAPAEEPAAEAEGGEEKPAEENEA